MPETSEHSAAPTPEEPILTAAQARPRRAHVEPTRLSAAELGTVASALSNFDDGVTNAMTALTELRFIKPYFSAGALATLAVDTDSVFVANCVNRVGNMYSNVGMHLASQICAMRPTTPATPDIMGLTAGTEVYGDRRHHGQALIGFMIYASVVRAEAILPNSKTTRFMGNVTEAVIGMAEHALAFLDTYRSRPLRYTSRGHGSILRPEGYADDFPPYSRLDDDGNYEINLTGHAVVDADLQKPIPTTIETSSEGCKSQMGVGVMLGGACVLPYGRKQPSTAYTTTDSEAYSFATGAVDTFIIKNQVHQLGFPQLEPWHVYGDSASCIKIMSDAQSMKKAQMAGRRVRTTQELEEKNEIKSEHISGKLNPADSFSKYTGPSQNERDMQYFMGSPLPPPSESTPRGAAAVSSARAKPPKSVSFGGVTRHELPERTVDEILDARRMVTQMEDTRVEVRKLGGRRAATEAALEEGTADDEPVPRDSSPSVLERHYIERGIVGASALAEIARMRRSAEAGDETDASSLASRVPTLKRLAAMKPKGASPDRAIQRAWQINALLASTLDTEASLRNRVLPSDAHNDGATLELSAEEALDPNITGARISMAMAHAVVAENALSTMGADSDDYTLAGIMTDQYGENVVVATTITGKVRVHTDAGVYDIDNPARGGSVFSTQGVRVQTDDGVINVDEPKTMRDVNASPNKPLWLEAMQIEVDTINGNDTYHLRQRKDLPDKVRIFRLSWKFKLKRHGDGALDKRKARLVLMGNMMVSGTHYGDTFAIGARMASVKIVFGVTAALGWRFDFLIDISGAYLNAWRPSDGPGSWVVSNQPELFEKFGPNGEKLYAVHDKYLYGDPASGRAWLHVFDDFLKNEAEGIGAVCTTTDTNLFRVITPFGHAIFAKHVDELVGAANTKEMHDFIVQRITTRFKVSCVGKWSTVLGFTVSNDPDAGTVSVSAERLISDGAAKFLKN